MNTNKYFDEVSVFNVIGNLMNNPSILDNKDKYDFIPEDFNSNFYMSIFGAINNLYVEGSNSISILDVENYLKDRPGAFNIYNANKGTEYLAKALHLANRSTFDYYYNRMRKMTVLREFAKIGANVKKYYDPDNIFNAQLKQEQEDWLMNTDVSDIVNSLTSDVEELAYKFLTREGIETHQAGESLMDLILSFQDNPDVGVPMYGDYINSITRGARLKKFYLRSAPTGMGKAIPDETLIPTPIGWRKVGDVKVGDFIFGQDGKPTKVLAIYPQQEKKDVWRITFADGRVAECCEDHLWEYSYEGKDNGKWAYKFRVESLKDLVERTKTLKNGLKCANNKGYRFKVKLNEPVQYPEKDYSIHPYVMGAILGDGSLRYNNGQKALTFSSINNELPDKISSLLGEGWYAKKASDYNYDYVFKHIKNPKHNLWIEELFKDYSELWQTKSETKFIPEDYLLGSIEQRYELLRGLLDTDGHIDNKGRVSYTTVSPYLRDGMLELCRSLGMIVNYLVDSRKDKYKNKECYIINIQCKKELKTQLFSLKNKKEVAINCAKSDNRNELKELNAIVSIEKLDRKANMTCFTVDNDDHLFLMNDFITTHNTRTMVADACYFSCSEIYDTKQGKWIEVKSNQPTSFFSTELELSEIQTMMVAFVSGVQEENILNYNYGPGELERVQKAVEIVKNANLRITEMPDFSLEDIENELRKHIREYGTTMLVFDYIHSSLKILEEITKKTGGVKLREDQILLMLAIRLKDLANQYGVFILSGTQVNGQWQDSDTPDQNLLRGAKSLADKIDLGQIIMPATPDDIKELQPILNKLGITPPTHYYSIYKNRRGKFKSVRLWCHGNLGVCRLDPIFLTDHQYNFIPIDNLVIEIEDEDTEFQPTNFEDVELKEAYERVF